MRTPKTKEIIIIQSKGDGVHWDDEAIYERAEYERCKEDFKEYCLCYANTGIPVRIISRRAPIDS